MFYNFLRTTFRNISKNKGFSFINIAGLSAGLAVSLLILLWIQDELSFDRFHKNGKSIFRVEEDQFYSGERYHVTVTPHPAGPVWKEKIPEIKEQVRINRLPRILFGREEARFFESSVISADSVLFRVFTLPLILGDQTTALNSPHSIVLTEKLASKYFGDENPVGNTLTIENKYRFMVTGVMKDIPENSIFSFEAVVPYSFLKEIYATDDYWGNNSIYTFVLLEKDPDIVKVNKKLTDVVLEHIPESTTRFMLFPFTDIHLHAQFGFDNSNGPILTIVIFSFIAVFVLLIACMNFINLSTARASNRSREIAVRKVSGADRRILAIQFMFESFLLVLMSMILALILVGLSLNLFNSISGKRFYLNDLLNIRFVISFIAVGIIAAFLSGVYPAFYLSSVKPVKILKGEAASGRGNGRIRQALVVSQFAMSILIAIAAVFMYQQLKLMQDKDLGFEKENLISIPMTRTMKGKYYSLKNELANESLISGVTASWSNPVAMGSNSGGASWEGKDPEKQVLIGTNGVDYDYLSTMKMELISGRDFSREFKGDIARDTTGNFLINEEVARIMDVGDPVGRNFRFMGLNGIIVGVLKNFNFKGADQPIEPMAFALADTSYLSYMLIRLTPGKTKETLQRLEKIWKEIIPEYPLQYSFVDQDYKNLFRSQIRLTELLKYFTILSLIIACLGLYGLSAYSAAKRTNEIGIRKVMGANSFSIITSLVKEFLKLILISILIAFPVGWLIVDKLLSQFAYRIEINYVVFVLLGLAAIVVASITVSFHAFKATEINPVEALKIE